MDLLEVETIQVVLLHECYESVDECRAVLRCNCRREILGTGPATDGEMGVLVL